MSERIIIFDTTLRDGEQSPGASLNLVEKVEIAHQLAVLGVDVIEAGFPISSPGDFEAVSAVAREVEGPIICGLSRARRQDIECCYQAVRHSRRPRIHTFIATSDIHVEKKLRKSKEEIIAIAVDAVKFAKSLVSDVEFSCEDAARTNLDYMCEVLRAVIDAGATTVNIPDTVGYSNPWEFGRIIAHIRQHVPNIERAVISVHCHNDLGLAVANSLAAVREGARQVECTINGIGERAGNASLEEIVMNLAVRQDSFPFHTGIKTQEIYRTSRMVSRLTGLLVQANKAVVGGNSFAHEAGIHQDGVLKERTTYEIMTPESVGWTGTSMVLGKHSGRHAFRDRLIQLGFNLDEAGVDTAFARFKALADKKKEIFDDDLAVIAGEIVDQTADGRKETYTLEYIHTTSGNSTVPTATIRLRKGEEELVGAGNGDGPVDAAYSTIRRLTGRCPKLVDYHIHSVTSGTDALGEVRVALEEDGKTAVGRSSSTDVIVASALAYINALNRLENMLERKPEAAEAVRSTP
ncbi:2-isopropylmalate synthase [bacterium]|nr:2-isopropylmalate synthase [bacterium]